MAFAFDSLTFVISVCSLAAIRSIAKVSQENSNEGEIPIVHSAGLTGMLRDIHDGFRTILRSSWLLWSMIVAAFGLMAYKGAIAVSLPKLVFAVYSSGPWLLAAITTTVGLGAIAGALFAGQVYFWRRGIVGLLGYVLSGLALMVFSLPFPHSIVPFVVLPAAFLVGSGINVMQIIWVTLLYELVPSNKLGRVSSVDLLGSLGLLPIGYVLAGWLGDRVGPAAVFLLGGIMMVVLNLLPMLIRDIWRLE